MINKDERNWVILAVVVGVILVGLGVSIGLDISTYRAPLKIEISKDIIDLETCYPYTTSNPFLRDGLNCVCEDPEATR